MTILEPITSTTDGLDARRYGRLLARFNPKVIETEAENDAALAIVESLMRKGDDRRSPEEDALLDLLTNLIERYEQRALPALPEGEPVDVLKLLMESNGVRPVDLAEIFGSRGRVSDVLSGRRRISRDQAKRLGERFRLSPAAFL